MASYDDPEIQPVVGSIGEGRAAVSDIGAKPQQI